MPLLEAVIVGVPLREREAVALAVVDGEGLRELAIRAGRRGALGSSAWRVGEK